MQTRSQPSGGISRHASASASQALRRSERSTGARSSRPAAIPAARWSTPPGYITPTSPRTAGTLARQLLVPRMGGRDVDDPEPLGPDWVVMRTRLCGICGSDSKQVFMDTGGDWPDAGMTAFISFPQILGHEVVGTIAET